MDVRGVTERRVYASPIELDVPGRRRFVMDAAAIRLVSAPLGNCNLSLYRRGRESKAVEASDMDQSY